MTQYYCDRCGDRITDLDLFSSQVKIKTEKNFVPCSNRANKFITKWCTGDEMLLCSHCAHGLINYLIKHES